MRVRALRAAIALILRTPQSRAELTGLASLLAFYQARVFALLVTGRERRVRREAGRPRGLECGWTDIEGAAKFLGRSERWIYDNWQRLPFARKWGAKALAFNLEGMRRWDGRLLSDERRRA